MSTAIVTDAMSMSEDDFVARHEAPGVIIQVAEIGGDGDYHTRIASNGASVTLTVEVASVAKRETANAFSFVSVGRASNNDIVIRSSSVSKCHACFEKLGDEYRVRDGGSKNGTDVNGKLLADREVRTLTSGDQIRLSRQVALKFMQPRQFYNWIRENRARLD